MDFIKPHDFLSGSEKWSDMRSAKTVADRAEVKAYIKTYFVMIKVTASAHLLHMQVAG